MKNTLNGMVTTYWVSTAEMQPIIGHGQCPRDGLTSVRTEVRNITGYKSMHNIIDETACVQQLRTNYLLLKTIISRLDTTR